MKKILTLLMGIIILSMVLTGCGTPVETPTNVESNVEQTAGNPVQKVDQQEDTVEEKDTVAVVSKVEENGDKQAVSKESQVEKEPVETASKETSKTTASKIVEQPNEKEHTDAVANPRPEFTSVTALQNWMLSKNDTNQFAQDKQDLLSTMATGNQIVYYRPTLGNGNDILQLDRVKASYGVLYYYYEFVDDTSDELNLQISCYMDDTQKEFYNEIKEDAKNNVGGYYLKKQNNFDIVYADNQHGATMFCWPQFGGYILAYLEGENHADKVQEVIPYLNLEKVTLRTDLETQ